MRYNNFIFSSLLAQALMFAPTVVFAWERSSSVSKKSSTTGKNSTKARTRSKRASKSKGTKSTGFDTRYGAKKAAVEKCDLYLWWQEIVKNGGDDRIKKAVNCFSGYARHKGAITDLCPTVPNYAMHHGKCGDFFEKYNRPESFCAKAIRLDPGQADAACYGHDEYKCSCYNACIQYLTDVSGYASSGGTCCQNLCPRPVLATTTTPRPRFLTTLPVVSASGPAVSSTRATMPSDESTIEGATVYRYVESTEQAFTSLKPQESSVLASTDGTELSIDTTNIVLMSNTYHTYPPSETDRSRDTSTRTTDFPSTSTPVESTLVG